MKIEEFALERYQSLYENEVEINLTESGVHPYTLRELLSAEELERILDVRLGYGWTNGDPDLRAAIASYYPGHDDRQRAGDQRLGRVELPLRLDGSSSRATRSSSWVPNYLQIWGVARSMGCTVKTFPLDESRDWAPDLDELRRQVTPATRVIAVCHPNNPTGAVLRREEMEDDRRDRGEPGSDRLLRRDLPRRRARRPRVAELSRRRPRRRGRRRPVQGPGASGPAHRLARRPGRDDRRRLAPQRLHHDHHQPALRGHRRDHPGAAPQAADPRSQS